MKLFLLSGKASAPRYDVYDGFVIRARTELHARTLAAVKAWDEGADYWLRNDQSSCEELTPQGEAEIILGSFNAG